ncbi:MAG: hypothetical protein R6X29_08510 [Acidimicrobiia bacterium]|jgi:hypothetical protein
MQSTVCPFCGEDEDLAGAPGDGEVVVTCGACGGVWVRPFRPRCDRCGGGDLEAVPHAVVEKGRGTQLSFVGIRVVHLCRTCDAASIERWQRNRPNPLMPQEMPNASGERDPD